MTDQLLLSPASGTEEKKKKQVIMETRFIIYLGNKRLPKEYITSGKGIVDIGAFEIRAGGKTIPFDFEATCTVENDDRSLSFGNWDGFLERIFDVDPYHKDDWAEVGLTPDDITAALLGSADEITDFFCAVYDKNEKELQHTIKILSMSFENEHGEVFDIQPHVLQRYNNIQKEKRKAFLSAKTSQKKEKKGR